MRALVLAGALALCTAASFPVEQSFVAPLAFEPSASPDGTRLVWTVDARGERNLWIADLAEPRARPLTSYRGDDGSELGEVAWGRDAIAYTHSAMTAREVWLVSLAGGAPRRIGAGSDPAISPRGDLLAYVNDGKVQFARLDGKTAKLPQLALAGSASSLTWAPDGRRLAFVSNRGDHAMIALFDAESGRVSYLPTSFGKDRAPVWSPDGRKLAFVRFSPRWRTYSLSRRQGDPWSIEIADVERGTVRQAFRAEPGDGSVFTALGTTGQALLWVDDERLLFPWEHNGWTNLHLLTLGDRSVRAIAPGTYEVFSATVASDRKSVVFAANRDDLDARRLWRASLDADGKVEQVAAGTSLQDRPVATKHGLVFLQGDAQHPFRPVLLCDGALRALSPDDAQAPRFVQPQAVTFAAPDGTMLHAQLFLPQDQASAPRPAILFFHGGPARQMLPGFHPSRFYSLTYAMNQYFAARGYVVLSVNYRGGTGYGLAFREADGFGAGGASEAQDIQAAAQWLGARTDVDKTRIGLYGASYGGLMTSLGLAKFPELLAAGVDYAGVHDWAVQEPDLVREGAPAGMAETARRSSVIANLSRWRAPVLLAHADDDRDVPFSQSVALAEVLRMQNVEVEQLVLPDEQHDLRLYRSWVRWLQATDDFFARKLRYASQ